MSTTPSGWYLPPRPEDEIAGDVPDVYTPESLPPRTAALPPAPAGWHPDPQSPGILRYWDGTGWTEHRAAGGPQATAVVYNNVTATSSGSDAGMHLILTIFTCGMWLPIWILIEIIRAVSR